MKRKLNEIIYTISRYTEIVLSAVMLLVIITLIIPMLYNFIRIPLLDISPEQFTEFLGNALTLLIGVEFVKMLAKHTAENLLEVLMFAIARQMVVEHLNMVETLIGVVAIAVIFAIRKYLLLKAPKIREKLTINFFRKSCHIKSTQRYLYIFSEFVEHALRLQAQSERRLSAKCIDILDAT